MKTIECIGVKKFYGSGENRTAALRGVDLCVNSGELTLLVGPSGSGKTTLMSIIHTSLTPDEGDIFILGEKMNGKNEMEKASFRSIHIGVIFQALYLIPTLSVLENITLPLLIQGKKEEDGKDKALHILERLGIENKAYSAPNELSRGQQQRVAIARALINDPQIILCDEPTSALDQKAGFEFMSILQELARVDKRTVFVVTHDHRIFPFSDRIVNISDGRLEEVPCTVSIS